jgi:hypothetical protein
VALYLDTAIITLSAFRGLGEFIVSEVRQDGKGCIYTIGHSNHSMDDFLNLLVDYEIEVLVDVRTHPYSRYAPHFNKDFLKSSLIDNGFKYLFLGKELGGRPEGHEFYDDEGHVLYWRVAESPLFLSGIARLEHGIQIYRVAIMCSEENPAICHRHLLVGRVLGARGVQIRHIRGKSQLQTDEEVNRYRPNASRNALPQPLLFDAPTQQMEDLKDEWKSIQSVLHRKQRQNSSEF